MIKRFSDFQINELKHDTYRRAATQLRKLGGVHVKRAERLQKYSYIADTKQYGTFNVNLDITQRLSKNYRTQQTEVMSFLKPVGKECDKSKAEKIVVESPISVYITGIHFIDPNEAFADDELQDMSALDFMFFAIPEDDSYAESFELFMISVPIEWQNEVFRLKDDSILLVPCEYDVVKFTDRRSAAKFKSVILEQSNFKKLCDPYDRVREFFMEYSEATELTKLFQKLQSIPTNSLYQ